MGARRMTPEQVDEALALRERGGWSIARLAERYGVSMGAISYHCLAGGAESPKPPRLQARQQRTEIRRGDRVVRRFTLDEDRVILKLKAEGVSNSAIGERLDRRPHTIRGRVLTLMRHQDQGSPLAEQLEETNQAAA